MPLFTKIKSELIVISALMLWLPATPVQAKKLGWMTQDEISELPLEQQRKVPAWCGGRYYAPEFLTTPATDDTVITANKSRMLGTGLAELMGDVQVEQPYRRLNASRAAFNQETGDFFLSGDVSVDSPEYSLLAERMSGNQDLDASRLYGLEFAFFDNHSRGTATSAEQKGDIFNISAASYTTCPPNKNTWTVAAKDLRIDREEGWGTAKHATFKVYDVPFFYLPWVTFPVDDRRKTGLLFPSISIKDDDGIDYAQPIYLNLHPQFDATIAPRTIQKRGEGIDSEFRYLSNWGEGKLSYGFIESDRLFDDKTRDIASWEHKGQINRWTLSAEAVNVSDDFYFKDLDTGLDVKSQTSLPRQAEAKYRGKDWRFQARVQSWQTIDPTLPDSRKPYRRLPQLTLKGTPEIPGPFEIDWVSDFTRFDRNTAKGVKNVTGDRIHVEPAVSLPMRTTWGYIEPKARLYHTRYALEGTEGDPREPDRTIAATSIDSGLYFERDNNIGHIKFKQTLEPRLFYNKVPYKEQAQLPYFDSGRRTFGYSTLFRENRLRGYDRIGDEESLSFGVVSRFLNQDSGREVLRLRAAQAYNFADRQVQYDDGDADTRNLSPAIGDLTWYLGRNWQVLSELQWDTENNKRTQSRLRLGYNDGEQKILHVGYRQRRERNEEFNHAELATMWPVHRNWSLIGRVLYDLEHHQSIESLAGLEFRNCCVQLRFVTLRELIDKEGKGELKGDNSFMFQVQLTGLGGLGGKMEELLERSITGYGRRYGTNY